MKSIFQLLKKNKNISAIIIVIFFAILAGRSLIFENGYFNMHDDLQMMRQLELEKCILDGQLPCRWVPDMGYGYGFPLFNFYPPVPYMVGEVFRIIGFSFVDTAKLTFAISFIFSGITMYFLAKEFFGKWGGIVSSVFYVWAPYHSVDVYVRGAMNEAWALIFFPAILWTSYRLILEKEKVFQWVLGLAFAWTGLLLSHNLMVMIFMPVFAVWCFVFWIRQKNPKKIFQLIFSGSLALLLSAFFTFPAVFEQKYVHVDTLTQGYYEYIAHFATIGQLLKSRFWGYGPSVWGVNDEMPFQVGHIHWILSVILVPLALLYFKKKRKIDSVIIAFFFAFSFGWFAAFMAHQNSTFIWQKIPTLSFVQFPWRFLTLVILGLSFLAGSLAVFLRKFKYKIFIISALLIALVFINWNYFSPQNGKMGPLTDREKFSGAAWDLQRTAGIFDYLPNTAKENPKDPPMGVAEIIKGEGSIPGASQGTNWAKIETDLVTDSILRINIFEFPKWRARIDNAPAETYVPEDEKWGRMYVNVPKGKHLVYVRLNNTPLRSVVNLISLLGWVIVLPLLYKFNKKINEKLA